MLESALACRSDTVMATDIIPTVTGIVTLTRTIIMDIPVPWFTSGLGITGITGIIGAAVIADTFGITGSTGAKSKPVKSLSWLAIVHASSIFLAQPRRYKRTDSSQELLSSGSIKSSRSAISSLSCDSMKVSVSVRESE